MTLVLEVQARDTKLSAEEAREAGRIPAVFYGPKQEATSITVEGKRLENVYRDAGSTTIITLQGVGENKESLIHDAQFDPVTGKILHVDFYVIEKGRKVEISVPLEFVGAAPAEKLGHVLAKNLHEVEIEVAPSELPHSLEVDISTLENVGDQITAAQIKLPKSAELKTEPEEIVISVVEMHEEKTEEAAPEGAEAGAEAAAPENAEAPTE